ncbi:hypothetical protein [Lentzea aerocolonigenes]|uniref:hypothetical protein n=1 Tax=Lentzea aerocolonigenes TaxID=68170 RepID=UPI0004C32AB7|nr:hypothetical protein [Lentzea aerocolonigenes]MCP2251266.1 hypothetical protein [Lentzea aerocolonigenes]
MQTPTVQPPDPIWDFLTQALPYVFGFAVVLVVLKYNRGRIELTFLKIFKLLHLGTKTDQPETKELPKEPGDGGSH